MTHTKEPWHIRADMFGDLSIRNKQGELITADCSDDQELRIVACVNALAGLNPEGIVDAIDALRTIGFMLISLGSDINSDHLRAWQEMVKTALDRVELGAERTE